MAESRARVPTVFGGRQRRPERGLGGPADRGLRRAPAGEPGRVAAVHAQARGTLLVGLGFVLAAPISAVVPHDTGRWLPLHLFLVGGVLTAISGATQLLAVTWSSAPAPPRRLVVLQRWLLASGVIGLALSRELDAPRPATALAGTLVVVALVLLAALLLWIRCRVLVDRFIPAIDGYVVAIVLGMIGSLAGIVLATGRADRHYGGVRSIHVIVNLLGLVGLVIAATLPYFIATQLRARVSPRATPALVRIVVCTMAVAIVGASVAVAVALPWAAGVALGGYVAAVAMLFIFVPTVRRRQLAWAGPRVAQLCCGVVWWGVSTALMAVSIGDDRSVTTGVVVALVVGGYAQIVAASLAYFGPVLRGGGHVALSAGFATTRSWLALVVGNVAAIAAVFGWTAVFGVALGVWLADLGIRAVFLGRGAVSTGATS